MEMGRSHGLLGHSYIVPLEPQIDKNGKPAIMIYYHFPVGTGTSINQYSALVKPFRKLISDGKLVGKVTFVFYHHDSSYFILGSFAFTEDRIIFFPGLKFSRLIHSPDGNDVTNKSHYLEHFTLEGDFSRWHVTAHSKKIRYPIQRTKKINSNTYLWFVMSIPSVSKLETMPMTQEYKLNGANMNDLERRVKEMEKSVEGNIFPVLLESKDKPISNYFVNFEFFVSTKKTKELTLPKEIFVIPPPSSTLEKVSTPTWSRDIDDFSPNKSFSISIRTSKIRGSIVYDAVCYSGGIYSFPI